MRVALVTTLLVIGVAVSSPIARGARPGGPPSPAVIRHAVRAAERSRALWATINVCNTRRHPLTVGVRGQIPALGFPSRMTMFISMRNYSQAMGRFVIDRQATARIRLGRRSTGLLQGGQTFQFLPHTGRFDATIEFVWRRSGKVLAHVTRRTTAGHRDADFGSPPRFSAKQCRIP